MGGLRRGGMGGSVWGQSEEPILFKEKNKRYRLRITDNIEKKGVRRENPVWGELQREGYYHKKDHPSMRGQFSENIKNGRWVLKSKGRRSKLGTIRSTGGPTIKHG